MLIKRVLYGNPLPKMLHHYCEELEQTLERIGVNGFSNAMMPAIEGLSGAEKMRVFLTYLFKNKNLMGRSQDAYLQTWPALGLFDAHLWRRQNHQTGLLFHDPQPLSHHSGYGFIARFFARQISSAHSPAILSHSLDARRELENIFPRHRHLTVAHPIATRQQIDFEKNNEILVAGQYKQVRNLELLAKLGPMLQELGFSPKIIGRGWPSHVEGWQVTSRFVSEADFEKALGEARVVVIPYRHFYQSGVMIRALELGTLPVSPMTSFSAEVLGSASKLIVRDLQDENDWLASITAAANNEQDPSSVFNRYVEHVDESWKALMNQL
jgi:hypothetical protein